MFGARLADLRSKKGLSQYQVAQQLGFSRGQYANYEQGKREPDYAILKKLADYFNVPLDYLLGRTDDPTPYNITVPQGTEKLKESDHYGLKGMNKFPLGEVKQIPLFDLKSEKGDELFAPDNIIGFVSVPADTMAQMAIRVTDDSMSGSRINKGDIVVIREQDTFIDRQTALVLIPDGSLTLRILKRTNDGIILSPDNRDYETEFFSEEEITIFGIVVQVIIDYK